MEFCKLRLSALISYCKEVKIQLPKGNSSSLEDYFCPGSMCFYFSEHSNTLFLHSVFLAEHSLISPNTFFIDPLCNNQVHSILTLEVSSPSKENTDICGHVLHEPHNPSFCLLSDPVVDFLEV